MIDQPKHNNYLGHFSFLGLTAAEAAPVDEGNDRHQHC